MLYWALVFLFVAAVSAPFGFGGISTVSAGAAQSLFFVFLALFVISLVASAVLRATPKVTRLGSRPSVSRRG